MAMRRIVLVAVLAVALAPIASQARPAKRDVPDGKDCRDKEQVTVVTVAGGGTVDAAGPRTLPASTEPDRLAVCVHEGGTTLFYFGGDMQSTVQGNDGAGGTCGAIIVADSKVADGRYGEDWSSPGADGRWGTTDDHDC